MKAAEDKRRARLRVWLYALGAYAFALVGAFGLAWGMSLDFRSAMILVGAVAVIALFGALIPILRLGYERMGSRDQGKLK